MSTLFFAVRYFLIGVLLVLNIAILVLASSLFSVSDNDSIYRPIFVYLIFLGAFSSVFLIPIALIDLFRKGAYPSRVLFELAWLVLFWILHLAGASALTASPTCSSNDSCGSTQSALLAFSWISVAILLIHLGALLIMALLHANDMPGLWSMGVRDVPWFDSASMKRADHAETRGRGLPASQPMEPRPHRDTKGAPSAQAQQQPRAQPQPQAPPPQSYPWHGRPRSERSRSHHSSRSWQARYLSQSAEAPPVPGQSNTAQPRSQEAMANAAVAAARAAYPFAGQGSGERARPGDEEVGLEPMPVSYTLERTQPLQSQQQQGPSATTTGRKNLDHPFYNHAMYSSQGLESTSAPETSPGPESAGLEQMHTRRRSRILPSVPQPQASTSRSRSQPPGQSTSRRRDQPRTRDQQPPSDSLLFSSPAPQSQSQTQSRSRPQHSSRPSVTSPTRLLPPTTSTSQSFSVTQSQPTLRPYPPQSASSFYGTHVQTILRERELDQQDALQSPGPSGDAVSSTGTTSSTRRAYEYAARPKEKPMSAAQAYAAEAKRRAEAGGSGR